VADAMNAAGEWSAPTTFVGPTGMSRSSVALAVVRRAGPHVIEASLIPTALFYCCLVFINLGAAFVGAVVWLYTAVLYRVARRRPVPPLLVLGAIGITVRTAIAVASGSTFFYFAQPILSSVVMAVVFLTSVVVGRPMVERLALEFWPLTPETIARPAVSKLLRGLTFWWAGVNLAIGAATMTLLLLVPMSAYVALKQVVGLGITGVGIAVTIDRALRTARREGLIGERSVDQPLATSSVSRPLGRPSW
jgi:uncharacterized membrane protein